MTTNTPAPAMQDINAIIAKHFGDDTAGAVRAQITVNEVLSKLRSPAPAMQEAVLTDAEIREIQGTHLVTISSRDALIASVIVAGRAIEAAVLSKLRAPVADEPLPVQALRAAQNNIAACRPLGSSDPQSPSYDHDAFMWDYYQRAIDSLTLASAPVAGEAKPVAWLLETTSGSGVWRRSLSFEEPSEGFRALQRKTPLCAAPHAMPGCIVVQEADAVPHVHPEYGPGIFFTEDARVEFDAAPQAPAGWRWTLHPAGLHPHVYAAAAAQASACECARKTKAVTESEAKL